MEVTIIAPCKRKLAGSAEQHYPKDWTGDVPDDVAADWVAAGKAVRVSGTPVIGFTVDQVLVLQEAANHALAIIAQQQAAPTVDGETFDPETGELPDVTATDLDEAAASDGDNSATESPLGLEDLSRAELRALAKERGIEGAEKLGKVELLRLLAPPAVVAAE